MKIDFHSHMFDGYSSEEVVMAHKMLADHHFQLLKQRSKCEFFNWKIMGGFCVLTVTAFLLQDSGYISNAFSLILLAGLGCQLVFILNAKKDLEFGAKTAECLQKGLILEKQQNLPRGVFQVFENSKGLSHKGDLLSRNFAFWTLGLSTAGAGTILSLKVGPWLAGIVPVLSLSIPIALSRLYVRFSKKSEDKY